MFTPSPASLDRYADVLISFALNTGKGIKKNDTVFLVVPTPAIEFGKAIYRAVLAKGGNVILNILEDDFKLVQLRHSTDQQLLFFPDKYYRGLADSIDHWVRILSERDPMYLRSADPRKIMLSNRSAKPFRDWLDKKEDAGTFTWTLCLYPTEGMAKEANLSTAEYWRQIEKACFLDNRDPITRWKQVFADIKTIVRVLSDMPIVKLHVEADRTDLWVTLGEKRKWLGGSGRNIPSFEIFTSPDWRGTEGRIFFDLPLYRYGNIIKDISLEFRNGRVVTASARKNEKLLHELIKQKNADKIGEYSLTDRRFSRITRFMAETLYDENFGGEFGNTHLAVGKSYHDTYAGDAKKLTEKDYEKLGYNDSVEHTDIIASSDRTVTAILKDGTGKVIYEGGEFRVK
jgi:aminopeptidase